MAIPFTAEQFLSVFEEYNRAIGPAPAVADALGAAALVLALGGGRVAARAMLGILALFWAFSGAVYHLAFFRAVNPAAVAFGALFLAESGLLAAAAARREPPAFRFHARARHVVALALAAYAIVAYPLLGAAAGHGYPRGPAFGVTPCPTTIFTIALLLLAEASPPAALLVVPVLWSIVGMSAAVQLGIREDYGLGVAGAAAAAFVAVERLRARRAARRSGTPSGRGPGPASRPEARILAPSSLEEARTFLRARRIAVVGVSRAEKDFSRAIFRELVRRGHDAVPVNPAMAEADGRRAFARVADVVPAPDAALLLVPSSRAEDAVRDCLAARVKRIWFHRGAGAGSASAAALALCQANRIAVVQGLCPFMAFPDAGLPHRVHRFFRHVRDGLA